MIVHLHTICHNEIELIPFAIKYWREFIDHVYVYLMSSSNDGSREYLQKFPDYITIIDIEDNNNKSNQRNIDIKNNKWKISKGIADFVIVTDFDEFVYSPIIKNELLYMKENGLTIAKPITYHLISKENISNLNLNDDIFLHEQIKLAYDNAAHKELCKADFGKYILFNPNEINDINYSVGAHKINPKGNVKYYDDSCIFLIHAKSLGLERLINNYKIQNSRLSKQDITRRWGIHYKLPEEKITKSFEFCLSNAVDIIENINNKVNKK